MMSVFRQIKGLFNCAGDWTATVSTGNHCDQGREGAEAGDGHQRQHQVSFPGIFFPLVVLNFPSPNIYLLIISFKVHLFIYLSKKNFINAML